ncbi:MFS transporter [Paracoccus denitrificans]|uniref:MFS transporter n=1 Tax=Paracoccus denitrificans TaxID=266 RepID=UPI0018F83C78|nr:MFS transporter [Paracoccus denitrificans]
MTQTDPTAAAAETGGAWADLFAGRNLAVVTVMAGGVLLYAMNLYFTAALMPSIVGAIGGQAFYAWVTTGFVIAAIFGSLMVSRMLARRGPAATYILALILFAGGAVIAAAAPRMEILLTARLVQGLGGGLLAGLGYAVIRTALPATLWARATGLISAMWGLGTLFGPSLGGLFAEFGLWRWAFGLLALAACLMILPARSGFRGTGMVAQGGALPLASLIILMAAVIAISVSAILPIGWATLAALGAGGLLLMGFVVIERRAVQTILPRLTWQPGNPLKWIYLTVAALSAGVMLENFIPLFSQQLAGLGPLLAGLLGAVLSLAWVLAQLYSVTLATSAARARAIRLGPLLLVLGLFAYGLMQQDGSGVGLVALQALSLAVAGAGIGLCWPLLGVAAMSISADPAEGGKAAAAITTTQLIAFSVTSALAGVLMAAGQGSAQSAATLVSLGIAALCLPGIWFGLRAARGS